MNAESQRKSVDPCSLFSNCSCNYPFLFFPSNKTRTKLSFPENNKHLTTDTLRDKFNIKTGTFLNEIETISFGNYSADYINQLV